MDEFCKVSSRITRAVAQRNSPDKTQEKGRKKGREGEGHVIVIQILAYISLSSNWSYIVDLPVTF